jgi:hypothetical protein
VGRRAAWYALVLALSVGGALLAVREREPTVEAAALGLRVIALGPGCPPETLPHVERVLFPGLYSGQRLVWGPRGSIFTSDLAVAWVTPDDEGGGGRLVDSARLPDELNELESSLPDRAVVALIGLPGSNEVRPWSPEARAALEELGAELLPDGVSPVSWALLVEWGDGRFTPVAEMRRAASAGLLAWTHRPGRRVDAPLRVDR